MCTVEWDRDRNGSVVVAQSRIGFEGYKGGATVCPTIIIESTVTALASFVNLHLSETCYCIALYRPRESLKVISNELVSIS